MKKKLNNLIIISSVLIILVILTLLYIKLYKTDYFSNNSNPLVTNPLTTKPLIPQPIDRTKLYGSLFLENIDKTIKNLSNPDIKYEDKRIELNNYSDILL